MVTRQRLFKKIFFDKSKSCIMLLCPLLTGNSGIATNNQIISYRPIVDDKIAMKIFISIKFIKNTALTKK